MGIVLKVLPLILVASVTILLRLPYLSLPLDRDEGAYAYIGWLWARGEGLPYLSAFDHKPPLVYLPFVLTSLMDKVGFQSIRIFALFCTLATVVFFYFLALKLTNHTAAFLSTLVIASYLSSLRLEASNFNTEAQLLLPLVAFAFLVWKLSLQKTRGFFLALLVGIMGGILVLLKPVSLVTVGGMLLWFLVHKRNVTKIAAIGLGFFIPFLLVILYFAHNNALNHAIADIIVYNKYYTRAGFQHIDGVGYFNWLKQMPPVLVPFFALSFISLLLMRRKNHMAWWLSLILVVGAWIGAKIGGSREFPHYYTPLVLGMSLSFALWSGEFIRKRKLVVVSLAALFLIAWVLIPEFQYVRAGSLEIQRKQFGSQAEWFHDAIAAAEWIRNRTSPQESILVWANEPEIYYYSSRKAPTRYINFYGFFYNPSAWIGWFEALKKSSPDWIVTYANDPPSYRTLQEFFDKNPFYQETERVGTYIIFKKKKAL